MISFGPVDAVANNPTNALPANDANTITLAMTHGDATAARGDPLLKSVIEVLSTLRFIGDEWTSKMLILELTKPVLTAQSNGSVVITKSRAPRTKESGSGSEEKEEPTFALSSRNEVTVRWINKMTREKHILQHDGSVCDCEFFALYHLPCRHLIQYEVSVLQHKQLSMAAVGPRWFLRSFQTPKLASQRESNELEYHLL
ncbi:hypothetical protein PHYBOEH_004056 [Phytophthora boehmeriae]|uniref:SWIM-type domain-containing protein n=1 Tax=Phytophthora boehmeriae TaxID=109152 RepID=A0A8T1X4E5_9STRA|nr:hypothetical protein PHYBOEH_004056 [Phytophthora boehmeriae]